MDKSEAMELLLRKKNFSSAYKRLLLWDKSLSIAENAKNLGLSYGHANVFKYHYQIKKEEVNEQ